MANHRGGSGNFAEDRERASEAGKKGGQHRAGVISRMTRSAHLKQVKKVARAVTAKATTSRANQ
ncbi:Stress-induced protein, KGG, repeat [Shigella sonnei]|nr:Stress-induced protein, KGG, repeat [Shigella sonnei]